MKDHFKSVANRGAGGDWLRCYSYITWLKGYAIQTHFKWNLSLLNKFYTNPLCFLLPVLEPSRRAQQRGQLDFLKT